MRKLNISNLIKSSPLNLSAGRFSEPYHKDEKHALLRELSKSHKIHSINLSANALYNLDIKSWGLIAAILKNPHIETLNLSSNVLWILDDDKFEAFCEIFPNSQIKELYLNNNGLYRLDEEQWTTFCCALSQSNVTFLDLNDVEKLSEKRQIQIYSILQKNEAPHHHVDDDGYEIVEPDTITYTQLSFSNSDKSPIQARERTHYAEIQHLSSNKQKEPDTKLPSRKTSHFFTRSINSLREKRLNLNKLYPNQAPPSHP